MRFTYEQTKYTCYFSYIGSALINNYAPLLFLTFQNTYNISIKQIGVLVMANFITQMCVDFLGAHFIDKIGYRASIVVANFLAALGLILIATLSSYMENKFLALIIPTIIYAVGSGIMEVLVSPIIEALPIKAKSAALSILHSFYCWGCVLVIGLTTLFFEIFGISNWKIITCIWALVPMTSMILFLLVPIKTLSSNNETHNFKDLFSSKLFLLFFLLMICSGASEMAISQWASLFAESALKVSKTVGDLLGPCMFAILMGLSRVIYAVFHDKCDLKRIILLCSILCVVSYLVTVFSPNPFISLAGCAICGFSVGISWPGLISLAAQNCNLLGTTMFGILAFGGDIGCFSGPETVAVGASLFSIYGSPVRVGLLIATAFPIMMLIGITILNIKKEKKKLTHSNNKLQLSETKF